MLILDAVGTITRASTVTQQASLAIRYFVDRAHAWTEAAFTLQFVKVRSTSCLVGSLAYRGQRTSQYGLSISYRPRLKECFSITNYDQ